MYLKSSLTILLFALSLKLFAQQIPAKKTALSWFNLAVQDDMHSPMELDSETLWAIMFQKDNEEAKTLMGNSLAIIYDKVNKQTNITLLPAESLGGKVKYSRMGYPLASLKKASKKGNFEQYVKIDIEVSGARSNSTTLSREVADSGVDQELERVRVKPQIWVTLKFADKDGNTIDKVRGKYRHEKRVEITSRSLSSMGWTVTHDREADAIPYYYFLEKAVDDLVQKLK